MKEIEPEITYLIGYIVDEEFYASHESKTKEDAIETRDVLEKNRKDTKPKVSDEPYTIFVKKTTYFELI
jgi:hypothetical protein